MVWTGNTKAFYVLEFAKTESFVMVQWRFQTIYHTEPPTDKTVREWYMKFQQSDCLCTVKQRCCPGSLAETVERVQEKFVRSPQKSTHCASWELQMPQSSVWYILCQHLRMRGYRLQLLQALNLQDHNLRFSLLHGFPTAARGRQVC
jgi:hypothetical protein